MPQSLKRRTPPFSLRLSEAERQALEVRAGSVPVSTYIKDVLFNGRPAHRVSRGPTLADRALLAHLLATLGGSRVAPNLRALADAAASGSLFLDEETTLKLRQACDDVRLMHNALMRGLGKPTRAPSQHEVRLARSFNETAGHGEDQQ